MADSVRFPANIGGSGRTYTSDANPQTGVFNGGHRINFFPMLADTVAAAGYVSQYAQAIDGAKGNADRAEDAKGYVEAVAEAYNVNLLESFKRKATLGLDFREGSYTRDDGTRLVTYNDDIIFSVERATAKWAGGANGKLREIPSNAIAREWRNGKHDGALIEAARTNHLLWSEDLSQSEWVKSANFVYETTSIESPIIGTNYMRLLENTENGFRQCSQDLTTSGGQVFSVSFFVRKEEGERNIGIRISNSSWSNRVNATFNPTTGEFVEIGSVGNGSLLGHEIQKYPDGSFRIEVWGIPDTDDPSVTRFTFSLSNINSSLPSYQGDGQSSLLVTGFVLEIGARSSSYIPTASSPVTRSRDIITIPLSNEWADAGTFYLRFKIKQDQGHVVFPLWVGNSSGGTTTNSILLWRPSGLSARFSVNRDGSQIALLSGFDSDLSKESIAAFSYSGGLLRCAVNGVTGEVEYGEDFPVGIDNVKILASQVNTYDGNAIDFFYTPDVLSLSELEELTAL